DRRAAAADNPFVAAEQAFSEAVEGGLNLWRDLRDRSQELAFGWLYANPWVAYWARVAQAVEDAAA
ncbi:MAG: DUF3141 domain-containing protein, partial [Deferrisomatales bacterium]